MFVGHVVLHQRVIGQGLVAMTDAGRNIDRVRVVAVQRDRDMLQIRGRVRTQIQNHIVQLSLHAAYELALA